MKITHLGPYDAAAFKGGVLGMVRRVGLMLGVVALAAMLNGCTKCGPIWDDWFPSQKSCKSDHF